MIDILKELKNVSDIYWFNYLKKSILIIFYMKNKNLFKNKTIFITGGTGSFGMAAISQFLKYPIK